VVGRVVGGVEGVWVGLDTIVESTTKKERDPSSSVLLHSGGSSGGRSVWMMEAFHLNNN